MVCVRIAPSPTGIPHIGNTRTALFNYLFAKHNSGKFIVRIEDTDQSRIVNGAKEAIFEILNWLDLIPDETYIQSERLDQYKKHAQILLNTGLAYKDDDAVRFKMPKTGETFWDDLIGNKHISFKNELQEDFIILKSDGFPTYNFANVVDDHLMKISHVIRGEEFISSTPKHLQLYSAFGWKPPLFAHLPIVLGSDRTKLSKRHGAESVLDYRKKGYLREAVLNYMALLGWRFGGDVDRKSIDNQGTPHVVPREEREVLRLDFMIRFFELKDINTASPIFDIKKLDWFNGVWIRMLTPNVLKQRIIDYDSRVKGKDNALLDKIVYLAQTRMKTLNDFTILTSHFFEEPSITLNQKEKAIGDKLNERFSAIQQWNNETILIAMKETLSETKAKGKLLYKIITGFESGLPLPESLEILGKEKTLERLKRVIL